MTAALVPVKRLGAGKSRLEKALGREATAALMEAMLLDILETLGAVPRLDPVAVVTPDPELAELAHAAGARPLLGPDPGLNPSVERAGSDLCGPGRADLLVVLGDVAGVLPGDLETLLDTGEALGRPAVVVAASADGGTSALLRRPFDAIPSRFGPGSAARHREEAVRAGAAHGELSLPSLALDLDREADLVRFLETPRGGRRTRALLAELPRARAGDGAP